MIRWIPGIIFWGWNALFLLFVALIMFSGLAPAVFIAVFTGNIPVSFALSILLQIIAPIAAIVIVLRRKERDAGFLMRLFFGFELPIFLAALIRLFVLRQMTMGTSLLLISIVIACVYFLWSLYDGKFNIRNRTAAAAHAVPATIMLVFGVGSAAFLAVYVPPVAVALAKFIWELLAAFFSFEWLSDLENVLTTGYFAFTLMVFMALFLFSAVVFVVAPFFMARYYGGAWLRARGLAAPHINGAVFLVLSLVVGAGWISAYTASGHHREAATVVWLDEQQSLADVRDDIEQRRESIRRDLLKAYLYRYRYIQTRSVTDGVARLYRSELKLPDAAANAVQSLHRFILTPLLYAGERNDDQTAARLYYDIFDKPIQEAERAPIKRALQATWNRDEAEAGLLDIDSRKVFIAEQHVTVEEFASHASIEVEEVYENRTFEQQEVYYYFSLPEDAAITGLWLGFGPDRSKHDEFIVAPRGAAQEVYEREVQRRVDPALLEQVGPRQYRLRAFPVPANLPPRVHWQADNDEDRRLRMRFTYAVPKDGADIASPQLLEKRNVFWTEKTKRTLNGAESKEESWLPQVVAATASTAANESTVVLDEGYRVSRGAASVSDSVLSVAVLIDTSWSMRDHDDALKQELHALAKGPAVEAEIFMIGANGAPSSSLSLDDFSASQPVSYFGSLTPQQMLSRFDDMNDGGSFDAAIVMTDQGRYEADEGFSSKSGDRAPLWFVHLGLPAYAYDDAILDLLYRSGGGAASSVDEAIAGVRATTQGVRLADGRAWRVESVNETVAADSQLSPSLAAIAARQVALSFTKTAGDDIASLDNIHELAKAHDIVTPWSSMIVLVNDWQRRALEEASNDADRFSREANTGEENLTAPNVTGVPEPHEWMLFAVAAALLITIWRRRHGLKTG